jgi:hypothetical protein
MLLMSRVRDIQRFEAGLSQEDMSVCCTVPTRDLSRTGPFLGALAKFAKSVC